MKNIPSSVSHAGLALLSALLVWAGQVVPTVDTLPSYVVVMLSAVISWAVGFLAPLVSSYGVGASVSVDVEDKGHA